MDFINKRSIFSLNKDSQLLSNKSTGINPISVFLKGVVFAVSSFSAIPYDPQRAHSQDLKAEETEGYNIKSFIIVIT